MRSLESSLLQRIEQQLNDSGLPTQFGPANIDLTGMTARKAMLMFQATAGRERSAWGDAAFFLAQREAIHLITLRLVRQALQCVEDDQREQAIQWLDRAVKSWPDNCDNRIVLEYRNQLTISPMATTQRNACQV